jgi:hypothetical protein
MGASTAPSRATQRTGVSSSSCFTSGARWVGRAGGGIADDLIPLVKQCVDYCVAAHVHATIRTGALPYRKTEGGPLIGLGATGRLFVEIRADRGFREAWIYMLPTEGELLSRCQFLFHLLWRVR